MTKRKFLLHPGYGKTGTSTLQKSYFDPLSKLGHIHYFGMFLDAPKDHPDRLFFEQLQDAMYFDDHAFEQELPNLIDALNQASARSDDTKPMVLSNEHFFLSSVSTRLPSVTIRGAVTAQRLSRVFAGFDVSLLFGLRRQDEMMRALFVEAAARTNHQNPEHFKDLDGYIATCLTPGSVFQPMYDFHETVGSFTSAFPDAPYAFYFYEAFVSGQREMLEDITRLMGLDLAALDQIEQPLPNLNAKRKVVGGVEIGQKSTATKLLNVIPGGKAIASQLRRSAFLRKVNEKTRPRMKVSYLTPEQSDLIRTACLDSNRQLASHFPSLHNALERFGYLTDPVADQQEENA